MPAKTFGREAKEVRVEGPGKAVEFSPRREQVPGQQSGEMLPKEKTEEPMEKASPGQVAEDWLNEAVEISNRAMEIASFSLQFRIHEESGRVQVKVVDSATEEIIREIPPEYMLKIAASIKEMLDNLHEMVGVLVNEIV